MKPAERLTIANLFVVMMVIAGTPYLDRSDLAVVKILLILAFLLNGISLIETYRK